ncbi:response regulator transcription factor [Tissierella sp. MB52-C2]|uniref:response regulator transcription factor n=1 Tax=Tissierella sp. MB52-C2 TaxID=3070999 RepID=UPI00280C21E4|nr:response regulator transcription factor [Tissierella sp. MB52-C2]WMM26066.1 response regulator transcription factor [Tissierella sp. MB52-C2]
MNILLIDDHGMFSESLKLTLERDTRIEKVDILQNIDKAKQKIFNKEYDIILMDINIKKITGNKDGLTIAKELLEEDDTLKIVMLTGFDMPGYESEAQKIGAKGFICKDEYTDVLIEKLVKVYNGQTVFRRKDNEMDELTEREKEILILYSSGLSRKEVADECEISVSSLAVALNRIYEKLDVKNYQEMINKALEIGYIKPSFF